MDEPHTNLAGTKLTGRPKVRRMERSIREMPIESWQHERGGSLSHTARLRPSSRPNKLSAVRSTALRVHGPAEGNLPSAEIFVFDPIMRLQPRAVQVGSFGQETGKREAKPSPRAELGFALPTL
jgi:hypothetical protein